MHGMRVALVVSWLVACGGPQAPAGTGGGSSTTTPPPPATTRQPVPCGTATCGVDEYCEQKCTCCGAYVPDVQPSGTETCVPLPPACHGSDAPECMQRVHATPCA